MHFNSALTATLVLAGTAFAQPAANVEDGSLFARQSDDIPDASIGIPSFRNRFPVDENRFPPGSIRPAVCGIGAWSGCKREAEPEAVAAPVAEAEPEAEAVQIPESRFGRFGENKLPPGTGRLAVCGMGQGWSGCKRDAQQEQENAQPEPKPDTQVERPFGLRQRSGVGGNMVAFPAVCGRWYSSCKRSPQPVAEAEPEPEAEALEIPEGRFKVDESRFPPGTARLAVCGIGTWSGCKRDAAPEAIPLPEPLPFEIPEDPSERARLRDDLSRQGFAFPAVCGAWHSSC
ncbi:unnamed protein product [Cercospora beticola]|nr:unnamed protein product [Cercospora beticola]